MRKNIILLVFISVAAFGFGNNTVKKIDEIQNNTASDITLKPNTAVKIDTLTGSKALVSGAAKEVEESVTTATQIGYLSTATSDIQVQLDAKTQLAGLTDNCVLRADGATNAQCGAYDIDDLGNLVGVDGIFYTASVDPKLLLDIGDSTDKGVIIFPILTTAQRDAIVTPTQYMKIFNSEENSIDFWTGTEWLSISGSGAGASPLNLIEDSTFAKTDEVTTVSAVASIDEVVFLNSPFNEESLKIVTTGLGSATTTKAINSNWHDEIQLELSVYIKTAASDVTLSSQVDGANQTTLSVLGDDKFRRYHIPMTITSGAVDVGWKIEGTNATIYADLAEIKPVTFPSLSSAHFVGSLMYKQPACKWQTTSATWADFPTSAGCPASDITGSGVAAPDTFLPAVKLKNVRTDGVYKIDTTGLMFGNLGATTCYYSLAEDASNLTQGTGNTNDDTAERSNYLGGSFKFTTGGDKTIRVVAIRLSGSSPCEYFGNEITRTKFIVNFIPDKGASVVAQEKPTAIFSVDAGVGQATTQNTAVVLPFNTIAYDNLGGGDNVLERYTVQKSGVYRVKADCAFDMPANNTTFNWRCEIWKNGVLFKNTTIQGDGANTGGLTYDTIPVSWIGDVVEGDYFEIRFWHNYPASPTALLHNFNIFQIPTTANIVGSFESIEKCTDAWECSETFALQLNFNSLTVVKDDFGIMQGTCAAPSAGNGYSFTCGVNAGFLTEDAVCAIGGEGYKGTSAGTNWVDITFSPTQLKMTPRLATNNSIASVPTDQFTVVCRKMGNDAKPKSAKISLNNKTMHTSVDGQYISTEACAFDGTGFFYTSSGLCETWVSSVTKIATGQYHIDLIPEIYGSFPVCVASFYGGSNYYSHVETPILDRVQVNIRNASHALADGSFTLICTGKK